MSSIVGRLLPALLLVIGAVTLWMVIGDSFRDETSDRRFVTAKAVAGLVDMSTSATPTGTGYSTFTVELRTERRDELLAIADDLESFTLEHRWDGPTGMADMVAGLRMRADVESRIIAIRQARATDMSSREQTAIEQIGPAYKRFDAGLDAAQKVGLVSRADVRRIELLLPELGKFGLV